MRKIMVGLSRPFQNFAEMLLIVRVDRQCDVYVGTAERMFPVARRVAAEIVQYRGASGHPLSRLDGKAVQGSLWQP
jgi:hypothetical protein